MEKEKRGRPMTSHNVRVIPEFREKPDIEKLARAFLAVAASTVQKKEAEEKAAQKSPEDGKRDDMT